MLEPHVQLAKSVLTTRAPRQERSETLYETYGTYVIYGLDRPTFNGSWRAAAMRLSSLSSFDCFSSKSLSVFIAIKFELPRSQREQWRILSRPICIDVSTFLACTAPDLAILEGSPWLDGSTLSTV